MPGNSKSRSEDKGKNMLYKVQCLDFKVKQVGQNATVKTSLFYI